MWPKYFLSMPSWKVPMQTSIFQALETFTVPEITEGIGSKSIAKLDFLHNWTGFYRYIPSQLLCWFYLWNILLEMEISQFQMKFHAIPEIDIIAAHKFAGGGPLMCIPKVDNRVIRKLIMHKKLWQLFLGNSNQYMPPSRQRRTVGQAIFVAYGFPGCPFIL